MHYGLGVGGLEMQLDDECVVKYEKHDSWIGFLEMAYLMVHKNL